MVTVAGRRYGGPRDGPLGSEMSGQDYGEDVTLRRAQSAARRVLRTLEIDDGRYEEHLFEATGLGPDQLADGLLDDVDDELAQEFAYQRRRMDGGSHTRFVGTRLRRSLHELEAGETYDITTSLVEACHRVLALEEPVV